MKIFLIITSVLIPVMIFINASRAKKYKKNSPEIKMIGNVGCVLAIIWFLCLGGVAYLSFDFGSDEPEYIGDKYSQSAMDTSERRVEIWLSERYVKLDPEMHEAHISPVLWNSIDVEGKEEMMATILVYLEGVKGYSGLRFFEFKNLNTDQDIGSWSTVSGFKIIN